MGPRIWISEIEFSDNSKIQFSQKDITVLVGPNNGGKSATLKEAAGLLRRRASKGVVLNDIAIERTGGETDLISLLESSARKVPQDASSYPNYLGYGFQVDGRKIKSHWVNYKLGLNDLTSVFVSAINTEDRLRAANPARSIKLTTEPPSHPIHFLGAAIFCQKCPK